MKTITRRRFLKSSIPAGLALTAPGLLMRARNVNAAEPSDAVRLAVIGMGSTKAVGGVGGRGHQLLTRLMEMPEARIVALCDVDSSFLDREAQRLKEHGHEVAKYADLRRVFDDKNIDAVVVATPNHWHALATIWACQAGKDVYVEKPFCYNLWEGRQMVAAARKHGRMVQLGTQNRSSPLLRRTFEQLGTGEIGPIRIAHAIVYRPRGGIGTVSGPTAPPATVDYDLWCGPASKGPLMRKQLHYEWHWFWATGNGEMGNNGIHVIDICRWALGQNRTPPRAISIGGRLAVNDCGETANTQIALLDYQPAPIICEVRNVVEEGKGQDAIGKFRNLTSGVVIDCEGGYFAGDAGGGGIYDKDGKKMRDVPDDGSNKNLETLHLSNFLAAVRSRKAATLHAEALDGYRSTAGCHMANVSHRLGKASAPQAIAEAVHANTKLSDSFERCREYLRNNGVDLDATPAALGPWVTFDAEQDQFVEQFASEANALSRREYREPFVVPQIA